MKKLIIAIIGINLMSIGVNLLILFNIGMGPVDTLTLSLMSLLNISEFGNASFLFHILFAFLLIIFNRKYNTKIGGVLVSILSILFITRIVNWYSFITTLEVSSNLFYIKFLIGFLILNLGLYLISISNLIIAPYDKFVANSAEFFNVSIGSVRVSLDIILLLLSILLVYLNIVSVPLSFGTLFITLFTGLNIKIYEKFLNNFFVTQTE